MANQSKALSLSLLLTLFSLFTFCDGNGEGGKTVSINGKTKIQPIATLPVKNRVVLFIDKTSSLVNVSQEDAEAMVKYILSIK